MLFAAAAVIVFVVAVACLAPPRDRARVGEAVRAVRQGTARPADRRLLAYEAKRRGLAEVAEDFYTQADIQGELERWEKMCRSPLPGITDRAWQRWVEVNEQLPEVAAEHPERTPGYGLRERELDDVNLEAPTDDAAEYDAFVAVTRSLKSSVEACFGRVIGTEIEGVTATLSGLLAVARCAGLGGLSTWVGDATERKRFGRTTQAYRRCNGLF